MSDLQVVERAEHTWSILARHLRNYGMWGSLVHRLGGFLTNARGTILKVIKPSSLPKAVFSV